MPEEAGNQQPTTNKIILSTHTWLPSRFAVSLSTISTRTRVDPFQRHKEGGNLSSENLEWISQKICRRYRFRKRHQSVHFTTTIVWKLASIPTLRARMLNSSWEILSPQNKRTSRDLPPSSVKRAQAPS